MNRPVSGQIIRRIKFPPKAIATAVFLAVASLSGAASAAGLGRLSVLSGIGQPLRAEVEVTALAPDESQSLSARLASQEAFRQAGLEFNPALSGLQFAIEPRGNRTFVRITSTRPINEPFVDLLVELNWATGKLLREYTFLLDPPEMRNSRGQADNVAGTDVLPRAGGVARAAPAPSAPVAQAAPAVPAVPAVPAAPAAPAAPAVPAVPAAPAASAASAALAAPAASIAPAAVAPSPPPSPSPSQTVRAGAGQPTAPPAQVLATTNSVSVRRGDTLSRIAGVVRPEGVSLDQAMVAIYRANPRAFIGNMNLVREGATLAIPDRGAMAAIEPAEAVRELRIQTSNFASYRQRLAGAPALIDRPRSGQSAAGTVAGRVEDGSVGAAGGDRLRLSKPAAGGAAASGGTGAAGAASGVGGRNSTAEVGVARDAAMKEATSRIADLEKNVSDLQKLLELKNKSLSDTQKQLVEARAASKAVTGQVTAPVAVEPPKLEVPKPEVPKPEVAAVEPPKAEVPAPAPAVEPAKPEVAEPPKAEATEPAKAEASEPAKVPVPVPAPVPAPAPVAETGFFDDLLDSPFLLPGLGGIAAVAAGYGFYAMRRRRKVEKFEDSLIAADAFNSNSLFGSTGGQSVDTTNSVFNAGSSAVAADVASTEVDPIAEADVYIAYGRESQAEDILKEALRRQPERQAIRKKLLEIYSGRRDLKAFEGVAGDMYAMTAGANDEWPQVVTMGLAIDPTNPLYGGSADALAEASFAGAETATDNQLSGKEVKSLEIGNLSEPVSQPFTNVVEQAFGTTAEADTDLRGLDFDLNIDTQTAGGPSKGDASIVDMTASADQDLPSLDDQFDLPSLDLPELGNKPAVASFDAPELDLDLSDLESLTQPVTLTADTDTALDLSDVDLELEPEMVAQEESSDSAAGRWQEMATKLDLASAYEEIGDKEGARELLQEVIQGGDGGQQQKARAMLSKIA